MSLIPPQNWMDKGALLKLSQRQCGLLRHRHHIHLLTENFALNIEGQLCDIKLSLLRLWVSGSSLKWITWEPRECHTRMRMRIQNFCPYSCASYNYLHQKITSNYKLYSARWQWLDSLNSGSPSSIFQAWGGKWGVGANGARNDWLLSLHGTFLKKY